MAHKEIDEVSGTDTTGHEWDGIKELDTPMPRWWLTTFYITIVWGVIYMVLYPAWPLVTTATKGVLGYSSRAEVAEDIAKAEASKGDKLARIKKLSLAEIKKDQALFQFALAGGKSAFAVNCSQCHGSGAAGAKGYPNLNDDEWIWGGKLQDIYLTIVHGVRFEEDEDTRVSEMPAFGRDELLEKPQIEQVAEYVLALSGQKHNTDQAEKGLEVYKENCAACHGETGLGDKEQGAPSLKDPIWLYGRDKASIITQINRPKHGIMPAWGHRLNDETIKQLTLFVHALGGGQ